MTNWTLRTTATWAAIGTAMPIVVSIFHVHYRAMTNFLWPTHFMVDASVNTPSVVRVVVLLLSFLGNAVVYGILGFGVATLADKTSGDSDGH